MMEELKEFFMNQHAAAGLSGAAVVVLASFFTDVFVPFTGWIQRTCYPLVGVLVGAWVPILIADSLLACFIIGAAWLHIPKTCTEVFRTYADAKLKLLQSNLEKTGDSNDKDNSGKKT